MTAAAKSFDIEWPSLERRLRSFLAGRGVPAEDRDDVVQETGIRLMNMWSEIDWRRSVWNLSTTIATRIWYDDLRRSRRHQLVDEMPEVVCTEDPESLAIGRLELSRVGSALAKLNPRYRSVLIGDLVDMPLPNVRPATLNVVRLRARRRLAEILGRVFAPIGSLRRRIRLQLEDMSCHQARSPEYWSVLASAGLNVIAAAIVVASSGAWTQSAPPEPARPEPMPRLVSEVEVGTEPQGVTSRSLEGLTRGDQTAAAGSASRSELARGWRQVRNEYHDAVSSYHEAVDDAHRTYGRTRRSARQYRDAHKDAWGKAREQWRDARDVGLP